MSTPARHARTLRASSTASRWMAATATLALVVSGLVVGTILAPAALAVTPPVVSVGNGDHTTDAADTPKDFVLAGEDVVYTLSIDNQTSASTGGAEPWYNVGFTLLVPNGVSFVSGSSLGVPAVFASGAALPNSSNTGALRTVPAGSQLWVWEDVSDLPVGGQFSSVVTVRPNAAAFPVGANVQVTSTGYASSAPDLKPIFDGSTGVGGATALAATVSGVGAATTSIRPVRITKEEPSPESELLRGVHENATTYTLTVENTGQGTTNAVTVTDYLPAGLEFLGCGSDDNTQPSGDLYDGDREYPGAGALNDPATTTPDCMDPASIDTVALVAGEQGDLPAGVYTKVVWNLGALGGGIPQAYPTAAGSPNLTTITYRAAVPLFENTLDWTGGAPSAASLEQGANLDNNNGSSTRQGQDDATHDDGISYRNRAIVAGDYAGVRAAGSPSAATDFDDEVIVAMDLRILKSVTTGNSDNLFDTGELATYTLDLRASEYTAATNTEIIDTLPNGLCPVLPVQNPAVTPTGTMPAGCGFTAGAGEQLTGATVTALDFDASTGTFTVTFVPDVATIPADTGHTISYTALMRPSYDTSDPYVGSTTSGDMLVNHAVLEATTDAIPALDSVTTPAGTPASGAETIWDDSTAEIRSSLSAISKKVLPRDDVAQNAPAGADPCATTGYVDGTTTIPGGFILGDTVCYELSVDFANDIDVRNPVISDFLPTGVNFADWAVDLGQSTPGFPLTAGQPAIQGERISWLLGEERDGVRYVPQGSRLVLHVWGTVTSLSPTAGPVDKPENLMKYQQENVLGEVSFLRDAAAIEITTGASLVKGVKSVNSVDVPGGATFNSNQDHIQVKQTDAVEYRVDVTAPPFDVTNMVVWDALPVGIECADTTAAGATCADGAVSGRSVVSWSIDLNADEQRTLAYTVTVPVGILLNSTLPNTASITSYDAVLNTGETTTFYPENSLDTTVRPAGQIVPGEHARDDSDVFLPVGAITKTLVSSEIGPAPAAMIDPNNGSNVIVEGELATYQYSVVIPAHTSVENGVLFDGGKLGTSQTTPNKAYTFVSASNVSTADTTGFTFCDTVLACPGNQAGTLKFPASYDNTTAADQVFAVRITVYAGDDWNDNTTVYNKASFTSGSWTASDTEPIVYREPAPTITKVASQTTDLVAGQTVDYTITVANPAGRPIANDAMVTDCVPSELQSVTLTTATPGVTITPNGCVDGGTSIGWDVGDVAAGPSGSRSLSYRVTVSPQAAGSAKYTNTAKLTSYTLPAVVAGNNTVDRRGDLASTSSASVTIQGATITKAVTPTSAPIGDTVHYTVTATLPANVNFYDAVVIDALPAGVTLVDGSAEITCVYAGTTNGCAPASGTALTTVGDTVGWLLGDLASSLNERTVTVTYDAVLTDATASPTPTNAAHLGWNVTDKANPDSVADPSDKNTVNATATVTILNPALSIQKSVTDTTPNPGDSFDYSLTVTNSGNSDAHNMVVTDAVPDGVIVDPSTITRGGQLTGATSTGGGAIAWDATDLPGPLAPAATLTLGYSATLAASSEIDATPLTNTAKVTSYESFAAAGRTYGPSTPATATVTPVFPLVTLQKTTTGADVAYAERSFGWTLTLTNDGTGPAQTVTATDTLPDNWTYDAGSALVSIGGAPATAVNPTISGSTLVWTLGTASPTAPVLAVDGAIVITFTATPTDDALTDAGVTTAAGTAVPHTNTLSAVTTDTTGATGNANSPYTGAPDTADAFIHSADLVLVKTAAATFLAGGTGTGWTIDVSNDGPDTAVGPFTVTDPAISLPAVITVTGASGAGWTCTVPSPAFTCTRTDSTDTLAAGDAFAPIAIAVAVTATAAPTTVTNTATVADATYDPKPSNNTDDADLKITAAADLAIVKTLTTAAPGAGAPITWNLAPANGGPSVSTGTVTVTDEIPVGIVGAVAAGTGWTCPTAPTDAGATITCTYVANSGTLALGAASPITVTAAIDSSYTGTILNTADIVPGATTDPVSGNNRSSAGPGQPSIATSIRIDKSLVTPVDGIIPGQDAVYEISVTNDGPADAYAVQVTDPLPNGLTFASVTNVTGAWDCTAQTTATTVVCDLTGSLSAAAGSNVATFRVTVATDSDLTGNIDNIATATADNASDASDNAGSTPLPEADLSITKTHPTGPVVAGTSVDYTLGVTNNGPSDSPTTVSVVDTVPAGLIPTNATGTGWDCTIGTVDPAVATPVSCDWNAILVSGAVADPITVTVSVPSALPAQTLVNSATVDGPLDDPATPNNSVQDPTVIETSAALAIIKDVASAGPYIAGTTVDYTVTVTNTGPSAASGATVMDIAPAGLTIKQITSGDWSCTVDTASCDRAMVPLGTSTITVTALIDQSVADGSALENLATLSWTDSAGSHTDDDPAEVTVTANADLGLVKTAVGTDGAATASFTAGTQGRYLLQAVNHGPSAASAPLTITDRLPAGLSYLGLADSGDWACAAGPADASGQDIDCTWAGPDALASGADAHPLTLLVQVDSGLPVGNLTNAAGVSSPTTDPGPTPNDAEAVVAIGQLADLQITKTHTGPVRIGDPLAFDIGVHNVGPSVATGVTVTDTLPVGLEYANIDGTDPAWSCTTTPVDATTLVSCALTGPIAPNADAPALVVTAQVLAGAYNQVVNTATVGSVTPDANADDNTAKDTVVVPPQAQLTVTKESVGVFTVNSEATYRLTVTNSGPTEDPGPVTLTDALPKGLAFAGYTASEADCVAVGQVVTCTLDEPLGAGKSSAVTLTVRVLEAAYPSVTNTVVVASPTEQLPGANLTASDTVTVNPAPPLASTGFDALLPFLLALLALLVGAGVLILVRRRRKQAD